VYRPTDRNKLRERYIGWENDGPDDNPDVMHLDWEVIETLCYELLMLPNPDGSVMEVTLKHTKRKKNPRLEVVSRDRASGLLTSS